MKYDHILKIDPIPFSQIYDGNKRFEVRKNDRNYIVGNIVLLRETEYSSQEMIEENLPLLYTKRQLRFEITSITKGYGLQEGYIAFSLGYIR